MTDLLKDTLTEHADRAQPPGLDLDAIITTGDRRIRRRRVVVITGTAMVTLAVLAGGLTLFKPSGREPAPATPSFAQRRATYATGSEIHYGKDVISIAPKKINAFVQTDTGFVFTATGEEGLFLADGKQVRKLAGYPGELTPLTAANHGNLVGWVEDFNDRSESVIYDVAAGREIVRTPLGNARGPLFDPVEAPRIVAIDGGYAYFGTFKGVYRWELATGQQQKLTGAAPSAISTVTSGRYLLQNPVSDPHDGTIVSVKDQLSTFGGVTLPGRYGYLSPSAKYLLTATSDPHKITPPPAVLRLFQTATAKELTFTHAGHPLLIFSQWVADDTFTAVGLRTTAENSPVDLLTCSTKSLTCETTVRAFSPFTFTQSPPRVAQFALPIGAPIRWLFG
ncbi:hypothetical protein [Streptomyces sp. SID13031]|uniref:hypothetical protein n=1 Tax=Streptomyces sp. SID13031 TaxID=2706046 RepID=UPI0013CB5702|nr:hypothetical protein [Streptomyces sp. SID13031]NEA30796.1 hypothetical protein [Streptomyces sp. SID13031]